MTRYIVIGHWGETIVRVPDDDAVPCTNLGNHPGHEKCAQRVATVDSGAPEGLAERIAWLLTHACPTCMGPQRETVGMVCQTCGTDYARGADAEPEGYTRCAVPWPARDGVTCDVERGHAGNHRTRSGLVWS